MAFPRAASIVLCALLLAVPASQPGASGSSTGSPAHIVVGFTDMPEGLEPGGSYEGARVDAVDPVLRFVSVFADDPLAFESRVSNDARVRYVEPDPLVQVLQFTPNDPHYTNGNMYGPQRITAPAAWDRTRGSATTSVCIVDSGVRRTHEDIPNERYLGGHDYWNDDSDPDDQNGHGTHVTGTIVARLNNGKGVAGLAEVSWRHVRVTNAAGQAYQSDTASAIRWCKDAGSHIITLSLGGPSNSAVSDAVNYAWNGGAVIDAASGNSGCANCVLFPAAYANVIAVGCTTSSNDVCSFSNGGPEIDVVAPGDRIASTYSSSNTAYAFSSGTSMSAPHVAGALALIKSHSPGLTNQQLRDRLLASALDVGAPGFDHRAGHGLIQVNAALLNLAPAVPSISCAPATLVASKNMTCTFSSTDPDGHNVVFQVTWGDGSTQRLPAAGSVASGQAVQAVHRYAHNGTFTLSVTATDDVANEAKTSAPATLLRQVAANAAPTVQSVQCAPRPTAVNGTVSCSVLVTDDSDGVAFTVDWGDGSPVARVPPSGFAAPGSMQQASHAFASAAEFSVVLTPVDDADPARVGAPWLHVHEVRVCDAVRAGSIRAGAGGVRVIGVTTAQTTVPAECWGSEFVLRGTGSSQEVDVCWYQGSTRLACMATTGGDEGIVPAGADRADVTAFLGYDVDYELRMGANSTAPPPPSPSVVVQDDDGERDATMTINGAEDRAVKYLRVNVDPRLDAKSARLLVLGRADGCWSTTATMILYVNEAPHTLFSPCSRFNRDAEDWASFALPLELLVPGIENAFKIEKQLGTSSGSWLHLAVDLDTNNGNSVILADGERGAGELMFRLEFAT